MIKFTVGELKEFVANLSDDIEVRIASVYDSKTDEYTHVSTCGVSYIKDDYGSYLVLDPSEISFE